MIALTEPSLTPSAAAAASRAYHLAGSPFAASSETESEFIERHLPLIKTVVGRMRVHLPPHLETDDLLSAGLTGLMAAVRKYDPVQSDAFLGYAMLCIRGAVLDELRRMDWMPRGLRAKARSLRDALAELESQRGGAITEQEAAVSLGMGLSEYRALLDEVRPISFVSLDGEADENGEGGDLHETIADLHQDLPGQALEQRELVATVAERIARLPDMQRKVLAFYYYEDMRLAEIAEIFGLTESRISQIHTQAIVTLRGFVQRAMGQ